MTKHILLVDDEKEMRQLLKVCINQLEFHIDEASTGNEAIKKVQEQSYDLLLLDVMMPEKSGMEVLQEIRSSIDEKLPIILLTALGETENIVEGLGLGADDYIVKPFEPRELLARVESVIRRSTILEKEKDTEMIHDLHINNRKLQVSYKGNIVPFTKKEFQLFIRMINNPGIVYSREQLLELEWGYDYEGDTRTVDAHIKNVREKLKQVGYSNPLIQTVWGIGYKVKD